MRSSPAPEPKLANGAVTEPKLADGAVTDAKFGTLVIRTASNPLPNPGDNAVNVGCQPGEKLVGGGGRVAGQFTNQDYTLVSSRPVAVGGGDPANGDQMESWRAAGHNVAGGGGPTTIDAYAVCLQ